MNKNIKVGAEQNAGDGGYSESTKERYDAFVKVRNKSLAQSRIRELAEQAEMWNTDGDGDKCEVDLSKFAELIVLEMCGMMEQAQDDCDTGDPTETNWGYISQLQDWIDRFKEHFGVEE